MPTSPAVDNYNLFALIDILSEKGQITIIPKNDRNYVVRVFSEKFMGDFQTSAADLAIAFTCIATDRQFQFMLTPVSDAVG